MLTLDLTKSSGLLDLTKEAPSLKTLRGVLNWDPHPVHGASLTQGFDLDIWAFLLGADQKLSGRQVTVNTVNGPKTFPEDIVWYNNKVYKNGTVQVPVDNQTGDGKDDEHIDFKLNDVPADREHIDVFIFIHDAAARGQNFSMVSNAGFVLTDVENNTPIVNYKLGQYTSEIAFHVGRFSRSGSGWTFEPSGAAANANPNQVLSAYLP